MATLTSTYSAFPSTCGSSAPSTSGGLRIDPKYVAPSYPRRSSYNQPSQVSQSSDPSTLTTLESFSSQAQTGAQMNTEKYIISKAYESLFGPSTAPSFLQQTTNEGYDTSKWAEFEHKMSEHVSSIRPYLTDPTTAREIRSAIDEVLLESWGPGRTRQSVASRGMSGMGTASTGTGHSTFQRRPATGQCALSTGPAQSTHSHQPTYTHYPANSTSPLRTPRSDLTGYANAASSTPGRTASSSYMALPPNPYTSQGLLSQQSQGATKQTRPTFTQPPTFRRIYQKGEPAPSDPMSFESLPEMPRPVQSGANQSFEPSGFTTAQGGHTNPWVASHTGSIKQSTAANTSPRRPGGILKSVSAYQTTSRPTSSFFHPIDGMTPTGSSFFQDRDESRVQSVFRGPEPNTITKVYRTTQRDEAEGSYISARYFVPANGPELMVESCRLYDDGSVVPSSAWCLSSKHRPSGIQPRYHEASRHAYASTGAETRMASKVAFGRNSERWYKESEKLGKTFMDELRAVDFFGSEQAKNDVERASALWWARRRGEI